MYIFDSLSRKKKIINNFNKVNIYVCGVTAYDICHIGHARLFIIFDILIRYLNFMDFKVKYVRNITDIDDKIINISTKKKINFYNFVNKIINEIDIDLDKLKLIKPNYEPKVTNYINSIIEDINKLIKNGKAYINKNKDILFNIKKFNNYGILSKNNKKIFFDFTIWKNSNINNKFNINDFNWISPWGIGRPGWHIECSTISRVFFNNTINIHGGGIDLIFPHHENELAQSLSINENFKINIWMHVGSVKISGKKMSKSNGNFIYLRNLFKFFNYDVIKYYLSNKNYRNPIDFSFKNLLKSKKIIDNIHKNFMEFNIYNSENIKNIFFKNEFINNMDNNLNINNVYTLLNYMIKESNKYKNVKSIISKNILNDIFFIMKIIGLINNNNFFLKNNKNINNKNIYNIIENLIKKRNIARKNKNWNISDNIRNYLNNLGIILEDKNNKTIWYFN
ncbi:cysteine--tRNA ligase [Candidatus Nardonella dryophthoridicola]|uniref:cysteine--tRNA ligase n=1 Tax=Candidatus Nardonella dryophthoridicola TaxID=1971485 RepID=UPI001AD865FA|nr:cysteine--tRNA ligase [Candidatus Nardonella dryophthoridicola]QTJ62802.1 cysteine--tRNA ligase [Candidatus Nardonella dryophthoridicola]